MKPTAVVTVLLLVLSLGPVCVLAGLTIWGSQTQSPALAGGAASMKDAMTAADVALVEALAQGNVLSGDAVESPSLHEPQAEATKSIVAQWSLLQQSRSKQLLTFDAERERELQLALDAGRPLGERLKLAGQAYARFDIVECRERIRQSVHQWLMEPLSPKSLPDIPSDFRQVMGSKYGNIILGYFEPDPADINEYYYFSKVDKFRQYKEWDKLGRKDPPPFEFVKVTINRDSTSKAYRVSEKPRVSACIEALSDFNKHVVVMKSEVRLRSRQAWQEFATFCRKADAANDEYRRIALLTEESEGGEFAGESKKAGVSPKKYAACYRDLKFRTEADLADEVVAQFDSVMLVLGEISP